MGHLLGCARVSSTGQDLAVQLDALTAAGCARNYLDDARSTLASRPQLEKLVDGLLPVDTIVIRKLDRRGRSLSHLLITVTDLGTTGVGFRSLTEGIETTAPSGRITMRSAASHRASRPR